MIPSIIPQQNFEIIRDRIGLIIFQELENQYDLTNNSELEKPLFNAGEYPESLLVYVDRVITFDEAEMPVVNVSYSGGVYDLNNPRYADGNNTYLIDVYVKSDANEDGEETDADRLAARKLTSILGKIAFILRYSDYKTLGFAPGFIGNTKVASLNNLGPLQSNNQQDSNRCIVGRIVFEVRAIETVTPIEPMDASGFLTTVKLSLTDKGYVYIGDY
jgi:hypothetical protein